MDSLHPAIETETTIEMTRAHALKLTRSCLKCARRWLSGEQGRDQFPVERRVSAIMYHLMSAAHYHEVAHSFGKQG
jgi:hypothetical protein